MSVYKMLYPFQKKIVDKFKDRDAYGLFLDMGLGKTPTALGLAEQNKAMSILIISINSKAEEQASVSGSWLDWVNKMEVDYEHLNKWSKPEDVSAVIPQVLIINYESTFKSRKNVKGKRERIINPLIAQFIKAAKNQNVAMIIDESHKIKNLSSIQTKIIKQINTKLKVLSNKLNTYLLSGTPFTQGYIDLYSQLKMLGYSGTKGTFIDNFCERGRVPGLLEWQQPIVGYKNIDQLYETIHRYALTITSTDVIDLPEQIFTYHKEPKSKAFDLFTLEKLKSSYIEPELIAAGMQDLISDTDKKINNPFYRNLDAPDFTWFAETTGTFWLRARQASIGFQGSANHNKWFSDIRMQRINTFLKENRENRIIFYNYTAELYELYDICEKLGYKIDVYCGEAKSLHFYEQFEGLTETERINADKRVIIANFASGSVGLNLQLYNHCLISSPPLYSQFAQGIKRIHRIGQNKTTFYDVFYQDNWLDKGMLTTLDGQVEYNTSLFDADLKKAQLLD